MDVMAKDTLPFSDTEYSKLDFAVFPTIRRRDQYGDVGDVVTITGGEKGYRDKLGEAEIVAKEKRTWYSMNIQFRLHDTESHSGKQAYESINRFYRNDIDAENEELTLYWLKWVDNNE